MPLPPERPAGRCEGRLAVNRAFYGLGDACRGLTGTGWLQVGEGDEERLRGVAAGGGE